MRLLLCIFFFLQISLFSQAQTQVNIFYNDRWLITEKAQAAYFRNCIVSTEDFWHFIGPVRDFYVTGKLKMTGNYDAKGDKTGEFSFFYANGTLEQKGNFKNNLQNGLWESWYPDAKKKQEIQFDSLAVTINNYWDENGKQLVTNGEGIYSEFFGTEDGGHFKITGPVISGKRHGLWKCYFTKANGEVTRTFYEENFKNGKFVNGVIYTIAMGKTKAEKETPNKNQPPFHLQTTENFMFDYKLFGTGNEKAMIDYVFNKTELKYSVKDIKHTNNLDAILSILKYHMILPKRELRLKTKIEAEINVDGTLSNLTFPEVVDEELKKNITLVLNRITDLEPEKREGELIKAKIEIPLELDIVFRKLDIPKVAN